MGLRLDLHLYVGTFLESESGRKQLNPDLGVGNPGYSSRCRVVVTRARGGGHVKVGIGIGIEERLGIAIGAAMGDWDWD